MWLLVGRQPCGCGEEGSACGEENTLALFEAEKLEGSDASRYCLDQDDDPVSEVSQVFWLAQDVDTALVDPNLGTDLYEVAGARGRMPTEVVKMWCRRKL